MKYKVSNLLTCVLETYSVHTTKMCSVDPTKENLLHYLQFWTMF